MVLAGSFCGPGNLTFEETINGILSFYEKGTAETIVWNIRAPRIAVSLLTGACLGLAGVLIQLSTRSPLGDPNLFGIGGGAAHLVGAREHDFADEFLGGPTVGDKPRGEPIEQFWVGRRVALRAEVAAGNHEPAAKVPLPNAIHPHARGERMLRISEPSGQRLARLIAGRRCGAEDARPQVYPHASDHEHH